MFLLGSGCLLIAFVAFQLWGTAIYTDHAQSNLRNQISHELGGRSTLPLKALGSAQPGSDPTTSSSKASSSLPKVASSIAPTTAQPAVGQPIGILAIPKLGVDDVVVQGYGESQLQGGPGHYPSTSLPGQAGNAAIAGHRTTFAAPFYNLNQLDPGDPIFVLTSQGLFRYNVVRSEVVTPTDSAVLDASTTPELTLTTCNPRYSASQRLVVVAFLDLAAKSSGSGTHRTTPTTTSTPPPTTTRTGKTTTQTGSGGTSLGGTSSPGDPVIPAILWGAATLLGAIALRIFSRRLRRPLNWASYVIGVPILLVALFFCFEHVSLALPASF
jgi:sortase A